MFISLTIDEGLVVEVQYYHLVVLSLINFVVSLINRLTFPENAPQVNDRSYYDHTRATVNLLPMSLRSSLRRLLSSSRSSVLGIFR